ncbi:Protein nud1 [Didymosphaeria variabile]|uniref:Protein nud1 n=1 Tax=Didymosphaeria variabile TaxID=1932322 RepID=A0A9W8XJX2_9PLEO|nr:Protein nud1 [Didymosphaeria variabile]KAJ4353230.1 Protein nud1 [Didymosphaeria variabile]
MSQPWLEDLSEEWIAQPTPVAASDAQDAPSTQTSQSVPLKPQSRLPRMRQSSGSFSEVHVRHGSNDLRMPKRRSALVERSLSDNNIPSADASQITSLRGASNSFSAVSLDSIACEGTVAQKPILKASSNDKSTYDTPEWRRRLLQGEIGYGDQKDLFSPMGLENIFQRPNGTASEEKMPKRRGGMLKGLSAMPSSPPPWPARDEDSVQECSVVQHIDASQDITSEEPTQDRSDSIVEGSALKGTEVSANSLQFEQGQPRTVSGQIEYDNENFSPVYLTQNFGVGAQRDPMPNFRGSELANRLRHLGSPHEQQELSVQEEEFVSQSHADSSFVRLQDDSLPEGLPAGTPSTVDVADVGRFVEMKRGGYSRDGSFRRRPLSPSPERLKKQSGLRTESIPTVNVSANATPERPSDEAVAEEESVSPKTPKRHAQSNNLSPERTKGSGSPLKLFDAHDTFTSNRLQRRLSQLEYKPDKIDGSVSSSVHMNKTEVTKIHKEVRLTSVEEASILKDGTSPAYPQRRRVSTFGEGDLNKYEFSGDFSFVSSHNDEDSAPDESPSMDVAPPGSRPPLTFNYDASPISREPSRARRQAMARASSHYRVPSLAIPKIVRQASGSSEQEILASSHDYAEGKRGPTSPFKHPTPKRRRTIQRDDEEFLPDVDLQSVHETRAQTPSHSGRKRKDARHETSNNTADPEILARRHILRPRNPTPSQRRLDELHADIIEATEAFIHSSPKMHAIREQIEPVYEEDSLAEEDRAAIVAEEVAAFSLERQQVMRDDTRKRSVTTQDFLAEAVKIMDFIRAKGKPANGLGSLEESESENPAAFEKPDYPSSSFTFDRPPSREGRESAWKDPNKAELDPQKMSHLRKYQEKDSDEFVGSSFRSFRLSRIRGVSAQEDNSIIVEQDGIRIIDNPNRDIEPVSDSNQGHSQGRTNGSHPSMMSSMGNTVATSTSRKSDHVNTLAPAAVAHLIPQEVAGMSFDPEKNIWVRQKSPSREYRIEEEHSGANESEEDPFGNIPDLTVDETAERMVDKPSPTRPQATAETLLEDTEDTPQAFDEKARPVTRDGAGTVMTDSSSVPSKVSNFAWSFPKTETRATSYSDQETVKGGTQKIHQLPPMTYTIPESDEDDIEHEIKYFEGRQAAQSTVRDARVRNVTISIAEDMREHEEQAANPQKKTSRQWSATKHRRYSSPQKSFWHHKGAHSLPHRPVRNAAFEETDELPVLDERPPKNYRMQLSMSVSAPVLSKSDALMPAPSSPMKGDVTFMLSDLPEFTLNQVDECEVPDRVVIKHDGYKFSKALEDRYALGTADLVKALQDVEPNEPYWEDLREVDLHGKDLENLHRLDDFCYRLEELNVSDNKIHQVKGIPYTMRRLWAQNNSLTGLTSWADLSNLQHLDISGNDIDSLDGLGDLVHLRTLKIDDNKILSLQGIGYLDGLMELSAARNEIEFVDFAQVDLKSLTDLNLRGNQLIEVRNVHRLPQLQHLDLDDNCIEEFPISDVTSDRCKALRSLRVCGNGMTSLDLNSYFPRLESLYADRNALTNVDGLEDLRHLRTFSARDQTPRTGTNAETCVSNFLRNPDVRNLYISLNVTRGIELSQHLLNLQRLELASMGLKELPGDFGQLTPNIRSINLNFNSIQDLRPLLNIKRLSELLIAGNKLGRLRTNAMVLGKLTTLTTLDWRDNPLTVRFYAPASENRIMSLRRKPSDEQITDRFVLPPGDIDEDQRYLSRLDYETRIRRRVTEMMLANFCRNLRELDGLPFDKARVLVKDDIWERLLCIGVIQRKQPDTTDEITD